MGSPGPLVNWRQVRTEADPQDTRSLTNLHLSWSYASAPGFGTKRPRLASESVGLALLQPYDTLGNPGKPGVFMRSAKRDRAGQTLCSVKSAGSTRP